MSQLVSVKKFKTSPRIQKLIEIHILKKYMFMFICLCLITFYSYISKCIVY